MKNRYSFKGEVDTLGRMFVYEDKMKEYDLSSAAIKDLAKAIKKGDLERIQEEFEVLDLQQKKGLLNLSIDFNDLWGSFLNLSAPHGTPIALARKFEHEHIAGFLEKEQEKLVANNFSIQYR